MVRPLAAEGKRKIQTFYHSFINNHRFENALFKYIVAPMKYYFNLFSVLLLIFFTK